MTPGFAGLQVIADLRLVRDEAGNEYVHLQGGLLRASVKHYLSTDGTLWDSMPLKKELRDATFDMAFALVLILNQVLSHATASVHNVRPAVTTCVLTVPVATTMCLRVMTGCRACDLRKQPAHHLCCMQQHSPRTAINDITDVMFACSFLLTYCYRARLA